jgi:diacylglycerol kinase (ATP)
MTRTTLVTIIYNPNSTGDGKKNARQLARELEGTFHVTLTPTTHAGHAEEIASGITAAGAPHIIVSSSGDGGYHEVVNGVLSHARHDHIVTAIIPSGNANDHYHALSDERSLAERIEQQDFTTIDVLLLKSPTLTRFAHSYIGFGVTPHIGEKLTAASLNPFNEVWIVLKNLFTVRPVKVSWRGHTERYDNLIFSNVEKMSKVIKLTDEASFHDGKFEITANKSRSIGGLIAHLLRASTIGLGTSRRAASLHFTLQRAAKVQLDGEVFDLPKDTRITVKTVPATLRCVA